MVTGRSRPRHASVRAVTSSSVSSKKVLLRTRRRMGSAGPASTAAAAPQPPRQARLAALPAIPVRTIIAETLRKTNAAQVSADIVRLASSSRLSHRLPVLKASSIAGLTIPLSDSVSRPRALFRNSPRAPSSATRVDARSRRCFVAPDAHSALQHGGRCIGVTTQRDKSRRCLLSQLSFKMLQLT